MSVTNNWLLIPKDSKEFFVVLGTSENNVDELHGSFSSPGAAALRAGQLAEEYDDYTALQVARVEVTVLGTVTQKKKAKS